MLDNIYTQTARAAAQLGSHLTEGQETRLPALQLAHCSVSDTGLAACLATLGIPFREPAPYTDDVALDEKGNELGRRILWWLSDSSGQDDEAHKSEEIIGAWSLRARFERDYPAHPLVPMRAALEAREWWCQVIAAWRAGRAVAPTETRGLAFATGSLREASVLRASGFAPIAFTGRAFLLAPEREFIPAHQVIEHSLSLEMTAPEQWMRRVLDIQDSMLQLAKSQSVIIRQKFEDQTLLLLADATRATRDKFHSLLS